MGNNILKNDDVSSDDANLEFKPEVIEAMEEAKRVSRDPNAKRYSSFKEALEDLDSQLPTPLKGMGL